MPETVPSVYALVALKLEGRQRVEAALEWVLFFPPLSPVLPL